jgi:benzoate/toluate 1,2-dioxygenase beta subunit
MTAGASEDQQRQTVSAETERDVERFLIHEAELLDTWRIEEWLHLFTDDCRYWVPTTEDDYDPELDISLIYDDYPALEDRVLRLLNPAAYTQNPRSRTRRLVGNVRIDRRGERELRVVSNFIVFEARLDREHVVGGEYEHVLRRGDGSWRIAWKKVTLVSNNVPLDNLTFLL